MPAYLVRLNDECGENARDLVGIFVAETMEQLFWIVDEAASPDDCECMELANGGIYWEEFTRQRVPRDVEPDWETVPEHWTPLPPTPELTDHWSQTLATGSEAADEDAWMPIVWAYDDEEDGPLTPPPPKPHHPRGANVVPFKRGGRPG